MSERDFRKEAIELAATETGLSMAAIERNLQFYGKFEGHWDDAAVAVLVEETEKRLRADAALEELKAENLRLIGAIQYMRTCTDCDPGLCPTCRKVLHELFLNKTPAPDRGLAEVERLKTLLAEANDLLSLYRQELAELRQAAQATADYAAQFGRVSSALLEALQAVLAKGEK